MNYREGITANPFHLKMVGFEVPFHGRLWVPGDKGNCEARESMSWQFDLQKQPLIARDSGQIPCFDRTRQELFRPEFSGVRGFRKKAWLSRTQMESAFWFLIQDAYTTSEGTRGFRQNQSQKGNRTPAPFLSCVLV